MNENMLTREWTPSLPFFDHSLEIKEKNMNENMLTREWTLSLPFFDHSLEQRDVLGINDELKKADTLEKKLILHEKMSDSQLKVIENLQEELKELKRKNKVLQEEVKRFSLCNMKLNKNKCVINLTDKLEEEIETLKSTVSSHEKVIMDQREMLNIQQEALMMSQDEVKELQKQLKKLEHSNEEDSMQVQDLLTTISGLQQALMRTEHQLEDLKSRCSFDESHVFREKHYRTLQSKCENLESKCQRVKEIVIHLLKQILAIDDEIQKCVSQETNHTKLIVILINNIKNVLFNYLYKEEQVMIAEEFNVDSEDIELHKHLDVFYKNQSDWLKFVEKIEDTEVTDISESSKREFDELKDQTTSCDVFNVSELFKSRHLNKLRKLLDVQASHERRTGNMTSFPLSFDEAISYCNYMEHEINKLQNLFIDFQWQMNTAGSNVEEQINVSESLMKVAHLEIVLNETCENYKMASMDCYKYQEQLLTAAEREVAQQKDFTAKERYLLEKMYQVEVENLKYIETVHNLTEELEVLHLELNERDCQLQNTASSLRDLSFQSSVLQEELQMQELNIETLQEQLLKNNIKLQQVLHYLDEKNILLQKRNKEKQNMQDRLKTLEAQIQNKSSSEKKTIFPSNLKT